MVKTDRPVAPEQRVTIQNVVDWQDIRARHDEKAMEPIHMMNHLVKAAGYAAAAIDKKEHGLPSVVSEDKRLADLIISSIWTVRALGYDPAQLVANRMWEIGIKPKQDELPPSERKA
jgi:hypothetical protein